LQIKDTAVFMGLVQNSSAAAPSSPTSPQPQSQTELMSNSRQSSASDVSATDVIVVATSLDAATGRCISDSSD
jgi:hypothetical protein